MIITFGIVAPMSLIFYLFSYRYDQPLGFTRFAHFHVQWFDDDYRIISLGDETEHPDTSSTNIFSDLFAEHSYREDYGSVRSVTRDFALNAVNKYVIYNTTGDNRIITHDDRAQS